MTKKSLPPAKGLHPLLSVALFGACGAAAMGHEVLWTRMARTLVGGDARGVAVAIVATLIGMLAGALLARRAAALWGPLRAFVRIELLAAITGALMPWLTLPSGALAAIAYGWFGDGALFTFACFVLATLTFLPASLAMGAGLPLLVSSLENDARTPAWLYGAHALGSAFGAWLTGFVLLQALGVPSTALLFAGVQLLACVILARFGGTPRANTMASADLPAALRKHGPQLGAVFVTGIASFALQSLWTRIAALALGPTVQAFALIASLYVLALSVGAFAAAALVRRSIHTHVAFAATLMLASIAGLAIVARVGEWPMTTIEAFRAVTDGEVSYMALAKIAGLPIGIVVACFGAAFGFAAAQPERTDPVAGASWLGVLLAAGALGNIVGALLAPFVLVPTLGLARSLSVAASLPALGALYFLAVHFRKRILTLRFALPIVLAVGVLAILFVRAPAHFDAARLTRGPFLYAGRSAPDLGRVLFSHDGVDSTVTVRESGPERMLQIDGKIDGSSLGDASTQTLVGLLPTLLAAEPKRVLVIGLGTGMTVDAVRSVPGVERVDVAELVAGVRYAAPYFRAASHDVLRDPRVRVREADGSLIMRYGEETWDVIVSEPSNPWVAGMGDLFSAETFRAARDRLRDGGVMATWFHVYATDLSLVREIMATFLSVFPNASLWELSRGQDYMLLGIKGRDGINADSFAERSMDPDVARALRVASVPDGPSLIGRLVASHEGVSRATSGIETLSLRTGNLEARAARALYRDASGPALELFDEIAVRPESVRMRGRTAGGRALSLAAPSAIESRTLARRVVLRALAGDENGAIFLGERAVGLAPHDPTIHSLVATLYLARGKTFALANEYRPARDALLTVLELDPPDVDTRVDALVTLGDIDVAMGHSQSALDRYQRARRMRPESGDIAERIAAALERLGARDDAARERALAEELRRRARAQ